VTRSRQAATPGWVGAGPLSEPLAVEHFAGPFEDPERGRASARSWRRLCRITAYELIATGAIRAVDLRALGATRATTTKPARAAPRTRRAGPNTTLCHSGRGRQVSATLLRLQTAAQASPALTSKRSDPGSGTVP